MNARESGAKRFRLRLFRSKRVRVVLLALLTLALLSQIPFIYRRYELGRLRAQIEGLKNNRIAHEGEDAYNDYRGVAHVHSSLGGHSAGTLGEIVAAARANELHFVVMTEHAERDLDTSRLTLDGWNGGALFIGGSEVSAAYGERLLIFPGSAATHTIRTATNIMADERARGQLRFVTYPAEFRSWEASGYDGIEVYNLSTNQREMSLPMMIFDGLWSYGSYPDLLFTRFYRRPDANLRQWDEMTTQRRVVAMAGADAHQNIGFRIGDLSGHDLFSVQLDPYERIFRVVRTHVLIERGRELNTENLLAALRDGHTYFSFDVFGDATGFRFTAENNARQTAMMGDEIALAGETRLRVVTPFESRAVFFKDGRAMTEARGAARHEFTVREAGVYRVEIYLPQLALIGDQPWIISNPIYIRADYD